MSDIQNPFDLVTVDPEMATILIAARQLPPRDYLGKPVAALRREVELGAAALNAPDFPCAPIEDLIVPGSGGGRPARLYGPRPGSGDGILLYLHGGGWTFGSIDSHDGITRRLADACGLSVLSLDYRLAPEHPFPAPLDDALDAVLFLEAGGLGVPIPADRIVIAGDSSGADIALATLIARRDSGAAKLAAGLLFYGCFAPDFETDSHLAYGGDDRFLLSTGIMRWFWANHLGRLPLDTVGLATPLRLAYHDLPPLFLDAASHDPLRDDTLRLAASLARIGAPHRLNVTTGVIHGYLRYARDLPLARRTIAAAGAFLAKETAASVSFPTR